MAYFKARKQFFVVIKFLLYNFSIYIWGVFQKTGMFTIV